MRNGFNFEFTFDERQLARLISMPILIQTQVVDKVLRAMAIPILSKAKAIAPRATTPVQADGRTNREKQSKKMHEAGWNATNSRDHLGYRFVSYEHTGVLVVGGKSPGANKLNFDSGEARDVVYWGKYARKLKRVAPHDRFMHRAYEETKGEQIAYGIAKLQSELSNLNG